MVRGICDMFTDVSMSRLRSAVGGTRKIGHVATVPGNLLQNYRGIILGLHGRLAWRKAKRGTSSLETLTEVGRRLQDVSFVFFLLLFSDVLGKIVRPHVLIVQDPREPWLIQKANNELLLQLGVVREGLKKLAKLVLCHVLLAQHLSSIEVGRP